MPDHWQHINSNWAQNRPQQMQTSSTKCTVCSICRGRHITPSCGRMHAATALRPGPITLADQTNRLQNRLRVPCSHSVPPKGGRTVYDEKLSMWPNNNGRRNVEPALSEILHIR